MNETQENSNTQATREDGAIFLDRKEIGEFTKRLSGKTADGESKVVISYQSYAMEEEEDSVDKQRVYTTDKPSIELSFDESNPQFYVMDIIFRSYDDPELKLLWGRLQRFKHNLSGNADKTWIFYFNILERASLTSQTIERDTLLTANIFNPTLFYLTREVPDMLAEDVRNSSGELYGGNVIRMLIPTQLVTFDISNDIDTSDIKGEIMREVDERRFINNPEDHSTWTE